MDEVVEAEVVEEEHGTEIVAADFARPVITPDEAAAAAGELRELVAKVLVKDKHYMTQKRKQKRGNQWVEVERDVLLKAGAEELGKVFGLAVGYNELQTRREDGIFYASVHASARNANERTLGESYGFFDSTERKNKDGSLQDTPANTIVKMAQKRAFVGAIMAATGTSELFTQDLEDDATPVAKPLVEDRMPSDDEKLLLAGLYAKKKPGGATLDEAMQWVASYKQKGESRLWVAVQVLGLMLKPDPLPNMPYADERPDPLPAHDIERLGPEPEIPPEPIPGQTSIEDAQDTPF